jgi:hypothetical protein
MYERQKTARRDKIKNRKSLPSFLLELKKDTIGTYRPQIFDWAILEYGYENHVRKL